jgi:hypothetical protein
LSDVTAGAPTSGGRGARHSLLVACYAVGGLVGAALLALLVLLAVDGHPLPLLAAAVGAVLPFPLRGVAYVLGIPHPPMGRKLSIEPRTEARKQQLQTYEHIDEYLRRAFENSMAHKPSSPRLFLMWLRLWCRAWLHSFRLVLMHLLMEFSGWLRQVFGSDRT